MLQMDKDSIANKNCAPLSEIIDCFSTLPVDMFIQIFKHLSLPSLAKCGTVSRYWYTITLNPTFYYNLSVQFKYEKQIVIFKTLIKRGTCVKKFEYKFCDDVVEMRCTCAIDPCDSVCSKCLKSKMANLSTILINFFQHCCQELTHLKLSGNFKTPLSHKLVNRYCCLDDWDLFHLNKLKSIDLNNQVLQEKTLIQLLIRNPELECLKIDNCFVLIWLRSILATMERSNKKMSCFEFYPTKLFKCDYIIDSFKKESEKSVVENPIECLNLKTLRLGTNKFPDYNQLLLLVWNLKNLTTLAIIYKPDIPIANTAKSEVERMINESINFCRKVFEILPKLQELELDANLIPSEFETRKLEKVYPKLHIKMKQT